jgi:hypothetical protein
MYFIKGRGRRNGRRLGAPQAAVGFVGNPSLCPAFRVRRGSGREYGLMTSRARRATRPTPSEFRCHVGMAPTSACRQRGWGHAAARFRPALSRSPRSSLGTRSESGGTPIGSTGTAGERGARRKAAPTRATFDQPHPTRNCIQPVPAPAGRSIVGDRAKAISRGFPQTTA